MVDFYRAQDITHVEEVGLPVIGVRDAMKWSVIHLLSLLDSLFQEGVFSSRGTIGFIYNRCLEC